MTTSRENLARWYDSSLTPLPLEYIQLIQTRFALTQDDAVVDLGCGSGLLTFALSRYSSDIQGIDSSEEMIKIARQRDVYKRIQWIVRSVEKFDLGSSCYKLIISFEAFHLFPRPRELVRRCVVALKENGYLCTGWVRFQWESQLKRVFVDVFGSYGISWGEQTTLSEVELALLVQGGDLNLSPVVEETVNVPATSHIRQVATYLASIEKAARLATEERECLASDLERAFSRALSSEWVSGVSSYSIAYCRKLPSAPPSRSTRATP